MLSVEKEQKTGKFLSFVLRHDPEAIGLELNEHGWASVDELLEKVNQQKKYSLNFEELCQIVSNNEKQRYSFNEDKTQIRANQGHSIEVDVQLECCEPPPILYHGSSSKYQESILKQGLLPQKRLYVHISGDLQTASTVGKRHGGELVLYQVDCKSMREEKHLFYLSKNKVWLTKIVPSCYLSLISQ